VEDRTHFYLRALVLTGLIVAGPPSSARAAHPLDPLTADEIRAATEIMRADARLADAMLPFISVQEPAKADVLAWRPGQPIVRRARAMATTSTGAFDVVVDLAAKRLVSVVEHRGAQGPVTGSESARGSRLTLENPRFQNALRARGITDFGKVFCAPWSAGNYGIPAHDGRRMLIVGCFDTRRVTNNRFGWPIERLYAAVDLHKNEVVDVYDNGQVPLSPSNQNFGEADAGALRDHRTPTVVAQPDGASFTIDGHEVKWGKWTFHVRIDPRAGVVISLARWQDGNGPRSVLYQGHLSEMFVPYMDPAVGWYSRTFFDAGEYGAGLMASRLKVGTDCPATATFLPATFNTDRGEAMTTPQALCIFERDRGEPIWRHGGESRRDIELVVRMAAEVGNYDYLLDWVFNDAAEIDVRVGATGIIAFKGVTTQKMSDASAAEDTRYGGLVAPGLVGTNHDHHFNFRLDLDVDGPSNSLRREVYDKAAMPAGTPRRSMYVVRSQIPETEKTAQVDSGHTVQKYIVINEGRTNAVGNPVGYELLHAKHGASLLDPDDSPARRARFLQHDVWLTQYSPSEQFAAGDYVFGSRETAGLPVWAEKNRPVRKQDIVVWANISLLHLTRAEDQPVMPTIWHSFKLRPFNFFDRNPALDLRSEPSPAPTAAK
jgi:primary-amine oxidase